jgi:hypothetical protein
MRTFLRESSKPWSSLMPLGPAKKMYGLKKKKKKGKRGKK